MAKDNTRNTGNRIKLPDLGPKAERQPHEIPPHERQIPANRPACPPIDDED